MNIKMIHANFTMCLFAVLCSVNNKHTIAYSIGHYHATNWKQYKIPVRVYILKNDFSQCGKCFWDVLGHLINTKHLFHDVHDENLLTEFVMFKNNFLSGGVWPSQTWHKSSTRPLSDFRFSISSRYFRLILGNVTIKLGRWILWRHKITHYTHSYTHCDELYAILNVVIAIKNASLWTTNSM